MTFKINTLNRHNIRLKLIATALAVASVVVPFATPFIPAANAATLQKSVIRLNRMSVSQSNDNTLVIFTVPAGNVASEDEVDVTFPSSTYFTIASPTIATTNGTTCSADAAASGYASVSALPGTLVGAATGQTVKVTGVTNLSASTAYCYYITAGVSTASTALPTTGTANEATIATKTSGSVDDSSVVTLATVSSGDDQVAVSATVNPYFTFTLTANSDALGTLTPTGVSSSTTPSVVDIATNAKNGWIGWVNSANAGLHSTTANKTIASAGTYDGTPSSIASGTEGYGLDAHVFTQSSTSGHGTVTIAPEYVGDASHVGTLSSANNLFASSNGPTDGDTVTLTLRAAISALTPGATDYADTLTVVGAGNF